MAVYNYNYAEIAKKIYSIIKFEENWTRKDLNRVDDIANIIKKEIAKTKRAEKNRALKELALIKNVDKEELSKELKEQTDHNIGRPVGSVNKKIEQLEVIDQPLSLLSRIVLDEDNSFDQNNIDENNTIESHTSHKQYDHQTHHDDDDDDDELKRFYVEITCTAILGKPPVQIFKGEDIIDRSFKDDEILRHKFVFYLCADAFSIKEIKNCLNNYFDNLSIIKHERIGINEIPVQFQGAWQNRTKL